MYRLVRLLAILITSTIAVIAVLHDFRVGGVLSGWGILAIGLASLLGIVSLAIEYLEHKRDEADAEAQRKEFEQLRFQLSKPVLPLRLKTTLKYKTQLETIDYFFREQRQFFQGIIDQFKSQGKFIHPKLADFPWDEDHQTNEYLLSYLDEDEIRNLQQAPREQKLHLLKPPERAEICLYRLENGSYSDEPDLVIETESAFDGPCYEIDDLRVYNENVYLVTTLKKLKVSKNKERLLSIYDLRGAKVIYRFAIHSFDEGDLNESKPYVTLLQLACGNSPVNVINLKLPEIGKPKVGLSEGFKMDENSRKLLGSLVEVKYEFTVPTDDFERFLSQHN